MGRMGAGGMGGRLKRERKYVYIQLIYFVVQQKLTQHCKAIIQQSRNIFMSPKRHAFSSVRLFVCVCVCVCVLDVGSESICSVVELHLRFLVALGRFCSP